MSASSSRRGLWLALGAICIVGGLVAAVLLWNGASQRRDSAIENLARAPIGCDTTLDFIEPGEYLLFLETVGDLDGVRGDCDVEGSFDSADRDDSDVTVTLVDPDGAEIDLDRSFGDVAYDAAGFRGVAFRSVDIEDTDDHVLRVEADVDDVFAVAVGRDPSEGVAALRIGAVAAGLIGVLAGIAFLILGFRKPSVTVTAGPWTPGVAHQPGTFVPGGVPPQGPPVYGQQGGPPQSGQHPPPPPPPRPPQPQFGPPAQQRPAGPPVYGQPGARSTGQEWPNPPQPPPRSPQPSTPPLRQSPPGEPDIAGQPSFPQAPSNSADIAPPIEWAPQTPAPESAASAPYPSDAAQPDAELPAQPRNERSTDEREPPVPPE